MIPRLMVRVAACVALAATPACAAGVAPQPPRPNEVQVVEPAGKPEGWSYAPKELSVARGASVTFVNRGREFHTVTSDDPGRAFDLSIAADRSATLIFDTVGTFAYHCGVHPQMRGAIRVCEGACP